MTRIGEGDRVVMQSVAGVSEQIASVWAFQPRQKQLSPSRVRRSKRTQGPSGSRQRFAVADRPQIMVVRKKDQAQKHTIQLRLKGNLAIYATRNQG